MTMFLDLAITGRCNLDCIHCFLEDKIPEDMPLNVIEDIVNDYMTLDHPVKGRMVLLSGGEPTCHSNIYGVLNLFHNNGWTVNIASNGYKIRELVEGGYIRPGDSIQISIDGSKEHHDAIRGDGSFDVALDALKTLDRWSIDHRIHFTLHAGGNCGKPIVTNFRDIHTVAQIAKDLHCSGMCINYFQPIVDRGLYAVNPNRFTAAQEIARKYYPQPVHCYQRGCVGGLIGLSVLWDGTYWNCSRSQRIIGKYPQVIHEVLDWKRIEKIKHYAPCRECMRFIRRGGFIV